MNSCLIALILVAGFGGNAKETAVVRRGLEAFGRGHWSEAIQWLEGNFGEAQTTREAFLVLGLAHAKQAQLDNDANGMKSFQRARVIFQSLAEAQDALAVQAALGLASLACLENHRPSEAFLREVEKTIRQKMVVDVGADAGALQKALMYVEFVRFKKAWKSVDNAAADSVEEKSTSKKGNGTATAKKNSKGTLGSFKKDGKQEGNSTNPGRGNLDLADWNGNVGPLNREQAVDLIEQASRKILYPGKASNP